MADLKIYLNSQFVEASALRKEGAIVVFLAADRVLAGLRAVSDPAKSSTAEALQQLKAAGIRAVMPTGHGTRAANAVAAKLGIKEVHSEVKPKDKVDRVAKLQRDGAVVAVAGDGISDAVITASHPM